MSKTRTGGAGAFFCLSERLLYTLVYTLLENKLCYVYSYN